MSLVLLVLSLAPALAHESMVRWLRAALRYIDRAAGAVLVLVGATLLGWELRPGGGGGRLGVTRRT